MCGVVGGELGMQFDSVKVTTEPALLPLQVSAQHGAWSVTVSVADEVFQVGRRRKGLAL